MKATRPVLEIFKMAGYFPDRPRIFFYYYVNLVSVVIRINYFSSESPKSPNYTLCKESAVPLTWHKDYSYYMRNESNIERNFTTGDINIHHYGLFCKRLENTYRSYLFFI